MFSTLLSVFGNAVKHCLVLDILIEHILLTILGINSVVTLILVNSRCLFVLFHSDGLLETVLNISRHKVLQRRYALDGKT